MPTDLNPLDDDVRRALFDAFLRGSPEAVLVTEGQRILLANEAFARMTGYEPGEVVGRTTHFLHGPLTDPEAARTLDAAREAGTRASAELRNYRKDGSAFLAEVRVEPAGATGHSLAIGREVTVWAGEDRLRRMVENLPAGAVFSRDDLVFPNAEAQRITGYAPEEVRTADDWFRLLHGDEAEDARRSYDADRRRGYPEPRVVPIRRKDGERRLVEFVGQADGECEVWLVRDLTDADRMARLLNQTAATARVGGWEVLLGTGRVFWTDETYRIHDVEPAAFDPSVDQAIDFYDPASRPLIREAVRRAIEDGASFDLELDLVTARGRPVHVRVVGVAEREEGRTTRVYGSIQDITERHQAQREREQFQRNLLQTQKLESLGVMAGGIAHDFNNLLTGVLGFAELARATVPDGSDAAENLGRLTSTAERAAELCKQMLAFAGKARFTAEPVSLNRLIEERSALLRMSVSKRATLTLDVADPVPAVRGDPVQLGQVLMNLVINASEALREGEGRIVVRTSYPTSPHPLDDGVRPGSRFEPGRYVCLEVTDDGCGMDEATRARIFEPFFTTKFTGRGLGLAAVLGIIRGHGGLLQVDSTAGQGSSFRIYFPPTQEAAKPPPAAPAAAGWLGTGRVLVVDDEPAVRFVAARLTGMLGFTPVEAGDGQAAVNEVTRGGEPFRAVLLDLTMPRMDGIQTLARLRAVAPSLPVVLMSGYSEHELGERYGRHGLAGFLQKPFSRDDLRAQLERAMK